jgi:hypothetical protein
MPDRPPFPIPEDINAEPFCLCLQIPNEPTWKRVVAGLLDELNQWYNWQRDEARSGKECAQVWRNLYSKIDWSIMSCCCDGTNPTLYQWSSTFILQISTDGGETWTDAPQLDPRNNSPTFPPTTGEPSDGKRCIAATGMTMLIKEQVGDNLTDDMSRYTLAELITDWANTLINSGGNIFSGLVTVIANQIFALVIATLRPTLTEEVYALLTCAFNCNMSDDLSFTDGQWEQVRADILSSISGIAGVFLEHLVFMLGRVGLTNLARSQAAIAGDCAECGCSGTIGIYVSTDFPGELVSSDGESYTFDGEISGGTYYLGVQFVPGAAFLSSVSSCGYLTVEEILIGSINQAACPYTACGSSTQVNPGLTPTYDIQASSWVWTSPAPFRLRMSATLEHA